MEGLTTSWTQIGATGLVTLVVLLVLFGKLVPKARLDEVIKEKEDWKSAAIRKDEAIALQAGQLDELMEVARTAEHLIRALPPVEPPRRVPALEAGRAEEA